MSFFWKGKQSQDGESEWPSLCKRISRTGWRLILSAPSFEDFPCTALSAPTDASRAYQPAA